MLTALAGRALRQIENKACVDEFIQPYNQRKQSLESENISGVKEKKHEKDYVTVTHLSARPRGVRL